MTNNQIQNEMAGISSELKQILARLQNIEIEVEATYCQDERNRFMKMATGIVYLTRKAAINAAKAAQEYSLPF